MRCSKALLCPFLHSSKWQIATMRWSSIWTMKRKPLSPWLLGISSWRMPSFQRQMRTGSRAKCFRWTILANPRQRCAHTHGQCTAQSRRAVSRGRIALLQRKRRALTPTALAADSCVGGLRALYQITSWAASAAAWPRRPFAKESRGSSHPQ